VRWRVEWRDGEGRCRYSALGKEGLRLIGRMDDEGVEGVRFVGLRLMSMVMLGAGMSMWRARKFVFIFSYSDREFSGWLAFDWGWTWVWSQEMT
jgi:hypothetical protein